MSRLLKILTVVLVITNVNFGQKSSSSSVFFTFFAGDLSILPEKFTKYYDSKNNIIFGAGFGIPLSGSITFDGSFSYYEKESKFTPINTTIQIENAFLKQYIFNAGFQYHLLPNRIIGLSFLCGANYAMVEEERIFNDTESDYKLEGNGNLGIYGGANFEISLGKGPVALYGDVKYTYSWDPILEYDDTYRDIKYTGGLKLYLSRKWR